MRIDAEPAIVAQLAALADQTRGRLLLVLDRHELTVGELCQVLQLPQSTVSRHLKTLADEGWVASHADGASRRYRLAALDAGARALWQAVRAPLAGSAQARHDARRVPGVLAQRRGKARDFFAGAAGRWDALRAELFGRRADLQALLALLPAEWVVGDLGCGTGQVSEAIAPFVRQVIAVDGSSEMLAAAGARLADVDNVELRAGELEALPIEDGALDAAVLSLVLHYAADPAAVLAEARRVLRAGGRLLVVDMLAHAREEYRHDMGHVWLGFDEPQLLAWLADAGFERSRVAVLPADPQALGPSLFAASAAVPGEHAEDAPSLSSRRSAAAGGASVSPPVIPQERAKRASVGIAVPDAMPVRSSAVRRRKGGTGSG